MIIKLSLLALASLPFAVLAVDHMVQVGDGGQLKYNPEFINAGQGDTVTFTFISKNHTATQSTFGQPCSPVPDGIDTGFNPVPANATEDDFPRQVVNVNDTNPVWFYCKQKQPTSHCAAGMVFAINPPSDGDPHSFPEFKKLAGIQNGTTTATAPGSTFTTPPPQSHTIATATITHGSSVITSTYTSYEGSSQPTYAPQPVDHKIQVGANGTLAFNPANITAALGDTVTFEFHPKAHGVTQSSFSNPCLPLANGFHSGLQPVASDNDTNKPAFQILINDTAPIWGYCPQTTPKSHCGGGMVFSINAVESGPNTFAAFQKIAMNTNGTNGTNSTGGGGSGGSGGANSAVSGVQIGFSMTLVAMTSFAVALFM